MSRERLPPQTIKPQGCRCCMYWWYNANTFCYPGLRDFQDRATLPGRGVLPKTNKLYITKINQEFEGDVFFPKIEEDEWKIVEREKGLKDDKNPYDYEYVTYVRK